MTTKEFILALIIIVSVYSFVTKRQSDISVYPITNYNPQIQVSPYFPGEPTSPPPIPDYMIPDKEM